MRRELAGVGAAMAGLILLGISLAAGNDEGAKTDLGPLLIWLGGSVVAAGIAVGPLARAVAPGAGLGIAAGILYAQVTSRTRLHTAVGIGCGRY